MRRYSGPFHRDYSSGKMGFAIAKLANQGAKSYPGLRTRRVETSKPVFLEWMSNRMEMKEACRRNYLRRLSGDLRCVADYIRSNPANQKTSVITTIFS